MKLSLPRSPQPPQAVARGHDHADGAAFQQVANA
jgi:hypothetical protein